MTPNQIHQITDEALNAIVSVLITQAEEDKREPLDGDDVDLIMEELKCKLNYHEGNLTPKEYVKLGGKI
jgi:hypothetical protein